MSNECTHRFQSIASSFCVIPSAGFQLVSRLGVITLLNKVGYISAHKKIFLLEEK